MAQWSKGTLIGVAPSMLRYALGGTYSWVAAILETTRYMFLSTPQMNGQTAYCMPILIPCKTDYNARHCYN